MIEERKNRQNTKRIILVVAALLCAATAVFSGVKIISILLQDKAEQDAFEELRQVYYGETTADNLQQEKTDDLTQEKQENIFGEALAALNPDYFGWLTIAGTKIDYPVMHTPNDPEYYLRRSFDKKSANSGTPFLQSDCFAGCGNYIIYGHNMRNKSMFGTLQKYTDQTYYDEHKTILFSKDGVQDSYEVFAVFYWTTEGTVDFYNYANVTRQEWFEAYVTKARRASLYETEAMVTYGDELLTLVTCDSGDDTARFVVVARKRQ